MRFAARRAARSAARRRGYARRAGPTRGYAMRRAARRATRNVGRGPTRDVVFDAGLDGTRRLSRRRSRRGVGCATLPDRRARLYAGFRQATDLDVVRVDETRSAASDARPFSTPFPSARLDARLPTRDRSRRRSRRRDSTCGAPAVGANVLDAVCVDEAGRWLSTRGRYRRLSRRRGSTSSFDARPVLMPFASTMARRATARGRGSTRLGTRGAGASSAAGGNPAVWRNQLSEAAFITFFGADFCFLLVTSRIHFILYSVQHSR